MKNKYLVLYLFRIFVILMAMAFYTFSLILFYRVDRRLMLAIVLMNLYHSVSDWCKKNREEMEKEELLERIKEKMYDRYK